MRRFVRADLLALAVLAGWLGWQFLPPLLAGQVLAGADLHHELAPLRGWLESEWQRTGTLPQWNPYLFGGYPNLTPLRGEVIYPFDVIFRWLTPLRAYSWSVFLHALLAAFGTWAAARTFRLSPLAAFLAAAVFTGSFPLLLKLFAGHLTEFRCISWFPLIVATLERGCRERALRRWLLLALLVALQALVWAPDVFAYCLYAYVLYALVRRAPRRGRVQALAVRLGALGLALALGLVVLLPTLLPILQLQDRLVRAAVQPSPINNQLGIRSFVMLVAPELFGTPKDLSFWGSSVRLGNATAYEYFPFWEETLFIGIAPLILAVVGMAGRRWRYTPLFLILLGLGLIVGLGENTPLYHLVRWLPGIGQFRVPSRTLLPMALFLALFAGRGLDLLHRGRRRGPRIAGLVFALAGGLALLGWLINSEPGLVVAALQRVMTLAVPGGMGLVARQIAASGFYLFVAAVTTACVFLPVARRGRGRWLLVAAALVELLLCGRYLIWQNPPADPAWVEELRARAAEEREPFRVLATKETGFPPDRFLELGIETVNGADPLRLKAWFDSVNAVNGGGADPMTSELWVTTTDSAALCRMNVKYFVSAAPTTIDGFELVQHWPGSPPIFLSENRNRYDRIVLNDPRDYAPGWVIPWGAARLWLWGLALLAAAAYAIRWRRRTPTGKT